MRVAAGTTVGGTVPALVLNNFRRTTSVGLLVTGRAVVVVEVVVVVPARIAGRVRFLKNGTVAWLLPGVDSG